MKNDMDAQKNGSESLFSTKKSDKSLSKTLLIFAWIVEVFAVTTGLFIAVMIGFDTLNNIVSSRPIDQQVTTSADVINTVIAVLPFVLVAVVELAKIPVAQAAYVTLSKVWKFVFFLSLVFLAVITFETTLNGLERNFSNLTFVIERYKDELDTVEARLEELNRQRAEAESLTAETIETRYNNRRVELITDRDNQVRVLTDRIAEIKATVKTERTQALQSELQDLRKEQERIRQENNTEVERAIKLNENQLASVNSEIDIKRKSLQQQLAELSQDIRDTRARYDRELAEAGFFTSESDIRQRASNEIEPMEQERKSISGELNSLSVSGSQNKLQKSLSEELSNIERKYEPIHASIRQNISRINEEVAKSISLEEADIKTSIESLYLQQKNTEEKFSVQLEDNSSERERQYGLLKNNQNTVNQLNSKITELNNQRVDLRNSINQEVGNNQIYRITRAWTGAESSADITRKQVSLTASVWFGSLALIVAVTGILLALASCVIGEQQERQRKAHEESQTKKSIMQSFRGLLAYKAKKLRKPKVEIVQVDKPVIKEVIKEVPVDKVVFKEVPKEIIKQRIVHVPIYTNDKSLLEGQSQ